MLMDDGSVDGSANSCDKLAKQHDGAIVLHKNRGVSVARNAGLEYVFSLDVQIYFTFLDVEDVLKNRVRVLCLELQGRFTICRL